MGDGADAVENVYLKLPALSLHEFLKREAFDAEMLADIWNSNRLRPEPLHCDDRAALDRRLGDHKGIGVPSAPKQFLLLNILLKMWDAIDLCDKSALRRYGRCEQPRISGGPVQKATRRSVLDLAQNLSGGDNRAVRDQSVETLPQAAECLSIVVLNNTDNGELSKT